VFLFASSGTLMLQLDGFPTGDGVKVKLSATVQPAGMKRCWFSRTEGQVGLPVTQHHTAPGVTPDSVCVCVCVCAQADRSAGRLTGSMMELQTLQEALKVEIQIHQVRCVFRSLAV